MDYHVPVLACPPEARQPVLLIPQIGEGRQVSVDNGHGEGPIEDISTHGVRGAKSGGFAAH